MQSRKLGLSWQAWNKSCHDASLRRFCSSVSLRGTNFAQSFLFCKSSLRICLKRLTNTQTPWLESASELYRPSDRRLSAKLVPTLADRGCRVVSATNPPQSLISVFQKKKHKL
jgi:hypothetical protein